MSARSELFFEYGDLRGEANFISWHQFRHRTYDLIASKQGHPLPMLDLTGKIDQDWLHRHYVRHVTHRSFVGGGPGAYFLGLLDVRWHNSKEQAEFLRIHAIEHEALDKFYGL